MKRPIEFTKDTLPRELAPGLFWVGECLAIPFEGKVLHNCQSMYVLKGEDYAMLVDCGFPSDRSTVFRQLDEILADGTELRFIFPTHQELPHGGGVAHLLDRYPGAMAIGDVRDYHLMFPEFADRFARVDPGDRFDLGGTTFEVIEPLVRDLVTTLWGIATPQQALFSADGYCFGHYHEAHQCGMTAEELPDLDIERLGRLVNYFALPWMGKIDVEPYIERTEELIRDRDINIVGSAHGLPVTDVQPQMDAIYESMRGAKLLTDAQVRGLA
jgi:flavorubredoxin